MRASQLVVQVRDKTLQRHGAIIGRDLNLSAVIRYCDVGEWTLTLPKAHKMVPVLSAPGSGIVVSYLESAFGGAGATLLSGPTEKPGRLTNRENPDGSFTFKGLTDDVILRDARAFPEPSNPDPATQAVSNDVRTGIAETLMRAFVSDNIGPTAHASRRSLLAAQLTLAADEARGPSVTKSPRFQNLLDLLREIAVYAELGFRVVQVGSELQFLVRDIVDRSATVRLDIRSGTLASEAFEAAPPTLTRAIVAGQGEGVERTIVQRTTVASLAAEAEWGRIIESWQDARGSSDPAELEQSGDEALAAGGATTTAVKLTPTDDTSMLFMRDWEVGDRVGVILPSTGGAAPFTPVVTAAALVVSAERVALGMSIGDTSQMNDKAATVSRVSSTTQRVENLERAEPTWATLGGIPAALTTDPGHDALLFWDDSAGMLEHLTTVAPLAFSGTTLVVAAATDTAAGVQENATPAEAITGTATDRTVTPEALAAALAVLLPAGNVEWTARSSAPTGWLLCDGSAVSRTTYAALFAAIGTTYGTGDGSTTFNVPDLKGRVPVGRDSGQTEFDTLAETGGAKTHTLTEAEMPAHVHALTGIYTAGSAGSINWSPGGTPSQSKAARDTGSTGGDGAHNNLQPYLVLNGIIKT